MNQLKRFDEWIASRPILIASVTFTIGITLTAVAFLVTGIRVSTEGWNVRGTLISNRYIQFETFVESGGCDDGACYVNPYRLNANALSAPKTNSSRRLLRRTVLEFPTHPRCEDLSYHGDVMYPNLDVVFMANDEGVDLLPRRHFGRCVK